LGKKNPLSGIVFNNLLHSKSHQGHSDSPDDLQDRIDPDNHNSIPRKNILRKHDNCHDVEFGAMA
jgi:hypothetical protein